MILRRSLAVEVRELDEEKREAEFVAATESPVSTFRGAEILRMSGANLQRYRRNPVVLDAHRMTSALDVIGSAAIRVDKATRALVARVRFDDDERSLAVWRKVQSGTLRALSIGFTADRNKLRELREGETDGEGDAMVRGPAVVVRAWELHEISVVPVPADADAVRRAFYEREGSMADDKDEDEDDEEGDDKGEEGKNTGGKARDMIAKAQEAGFTLEEIGEATDRSPGVVSSIKSGEIKNPPGDFLDKLAALLKKGRTINLEVERAKREAEVTKARREARAQRHAEIRALCPERLLPFLEGLLLEDPDVTFESARRALLEERRRDLARPVGTPEPTQPDKDKPASQPAVIDWDTRLSPLCGGR